MTVILDSLPAMDVAGRIDRLRAEFANVGEGASIDALLVTFLPNVRYLTGFTGSAAMLMVTADAAVFTSDGRYRTQSAEQLDAAGVTATIEIGATAGDQRDVFARALDPGARCLKPAAMSVVHNESSAPSPMSQVHADNRAPEELGGPVMRVNAPLGSC